MTTIFFTIFRGSPKLAPEMIAWMFRSDTDARNPDGHIDWHCIKSNFINILQHIEMAFKIPTAIKSAFKTSSVLRTRDLEAHGIWRAKLRGYVEQGVLIKVERGLYTRPGVKIGENHSLAEAGKRAPRATVCLLSALRFHGLTSQQPHEVWLAVDGKARAPKGDSLAFRVVRFSGAALLEGCEEHMIEGVPVKIYNPAKTVADCFKFRNKIGLDVALEALRETWRARRCGIAELMRYARVCRVANVMRPYLESLS
jgi:predicted transcriptional regulator of viral defense system